MSVYCSSVQNTDRLTDVPGLPGDAPLLHNRMVTSRASHRVHAGLRDSLRRRVRRVSCRRPARREGPSGFCLLCAAMAFSPWTMPLEYRLLRFLAAMTVVILGAKLYDLRIDLLHGTGVRFREGIAVARTTRVRPWGWRAITWAIGTSLFVLLSSTLFFASMRGVVPFYSRQFGGWSWEGWIRHETP